MAITAAMVKELRELTGAGMMDCKKALGETDGNMDEAVEYLRKNGQAKAEKKASRIAAEGLCTVVVKDDNKTAAVVEVNSETDFVAKNEKFQAFVEAVAAQAIDTDAADIEAFLNEAWAADTSKTVNEELASMIATIGENMNIRRFEKVSCDNGIVVDYIHAGGKIGVLVAAETDSTSDAVVECLKNVAMQVAAMNPMALDEASVPQEVRDNEFNVAVEKTKEEQVKKAVDNALRKAGFNIYISETEEHLNEGIMKGLITEAQADEIRAVKAKVTKEKLANLPEQMILNIANGRMAKFYKEVCLLRQEYIQDAKMSVAAYLKSVNKDLTVVAFRRFTLRAE